MRQIPFYNTRLEGSFWGEKQRVSREVTVNSVYDRFKETKRFDALKCDIEQQKREGWQAHVFWDSDVAKWIEGVAYTLEYEKNKRFEERSMNLSTICVQVSSKTDIITLISISIIPINV